MLKNRNVFHTKVGLSFRPFRLGAALAVFLGLLGLAKAEADYYIPSRFAGGYRIGGFRGDNGPANLAVLFLPTGIAMDAAGNIYFSDSGNLCIRRIGTDGIITRFAGSPEVRALVGDSGKAIDAGLNNPTGLAFDKLGNLFVADTVHNCIRRIDSDGFIWRVAGTGVSGFSPDGTWAQSAQLSSPGGVWVDDSGTVYIADTGNRCIRKVAADGKIYTLPGTQGLLNGNYYAAMQGLTGDKLGNLYIADVAHHCVRKIDTAGTISTVAGNETPGYNGDNIRAVDASLNYPVGVVVDDAGNLFITDAENERIRKVDTQGIITTIAGNGATDLQGVGDGSPATTAEFYRPTGIIKDANGNLYVVEIENNVIRKLSFYVGDPTVIVTQPTDQSGTVNQTATFGVGATGTAPLDYQWQKSLNGGATWNDVAGAKEPSFTTSRLALSDNNASFRVIVSNTAGLKVTSRPATLFVTQAADSLYIITTIAGSAYEDGFEGDGGPATSARLNRAFGVAYDKSGNLYISDGGNRRIRKISGNTIATVAGGGSDGSGNTGPALQAALGNYPMGLTTDSAGYVYFAESESGRVRKVANGTISTLADNSVLNMPRDVAVDGAGNVFIADTANHCIRKVDIAGNITPVAGVCGFLNYGFSGDNVDPPTQAHLYSPMGVALDGSGNIYIADSTNNRIRKVAGGKITTVAGNGTLGFSGDGGPATQAALSQPTGLRFDTAGNLFFVDALNARIRKVDTSGVITTIAGNGSGAPSGDGGPATLAGFLGCSRLAVDTQGNIALTDGNSIRLLTPSTKVLVSPTITQQPQDVVVGIGQVAPFSVSANGTAQLTYQWQRSTNGIDFVDIPGAVAPNYSRTDTTDLDNNTRYLVIVANAQGRILSNAVTLNIIHGPAAPTIAVGSPADQIFGTGQSKVTWTVSASGSTPLSYQWMERSGPGFPILYRPVTSVPTYTTQGYQTQVAVTVSNSYGSATSRWASLSQGGYLPPSFSTEPKDQIAVQDQSASFIVAVTGTDFSGDRLTLQWQKSTDNGATWTDITGANSLTYTTPSTVLTDNGQKFRVFAKNNEGSTYSKIVTLTVLTKFLPVGPTISSPPQDGRVNVGDPLPFAIGASGTPILEYQWRVSTDGGVTFEDIPGATTSSLASAIANASDDGHFFVCVVTNAKGSVTSTAAKLTVNGVVSPARISLDPKDQTANIDQSATFKAFPAQWDPKLGIHVT